MPIVDPDTSKLCGCVTVFDIVTFVLSLYVEGQTLKIVGVDDQKVATLNSEN